MMAAEKEPKNMSTKLGKKKPKKPLSTKPEKEPKTLKYKPKKRVSKSRGSMGDNNLLGI